MLFKICELKLKKYDIDNLNLCREIMELFGDYRSMSFFFF